MDQDVPVVPNCMGLQGIVIGDIGAVPYPIDEGFCAPWFRVSEVAHEVAKACLEFGKQTNNVSAIQAIGSTP